CFAGRFQTRVPKALTADLIGPLGNSDRPNARNHSLRATAYQGRSKQRDPTAGGYTRCGWKTRMRYSQISQLANALAQTFSLPTLIRLIKRAKAATLTVKWRA